MLIVTNNMKYFLDVENKTHDFKGTIKNPTRPSHRVHLTYMPKYFYYSLAFDA